MSEFEDEKFVDYPEPFENETEDEYTVRLIEFSKYLQFLQTGKTIEQQQREIDEYWELTQEDY